MHIQILLYLNVNIHEIVHKVLRTCHASSNVVLVKNLMFVSYREHFVAIMWLSNNYSKKANITLMNSLMKSLLLVE